MENNRIFKVAFSQANSGNLYFYNIVVDLIKEINESKKFTLQDFYNHLDDIQLMDLHSLINNQMTSRGINYLNQIEIDLIATGLACLERGKKDTTLTETEHFLYVENILFNTNFELQKRQGFLKIKNPYTFSILEKIDFDQIEETSMGIEKRKNHNPMNILKSMLTARDNENFNFQ